MSFWNFLEKKMKKEKYGGQTIFIDIPPGIYYKELAIYTASSLLENAISKCEIKVYEKEKPVKNMDYYILNVSPNRNENSNFFWHKVVRKMVRERKGALVVEINDQLHCAEDFSILEERPILGNIYGNVVLDGGFQLSRVFRAEEVYLFKMEDENVKRLIDGIYEDYGRLLESAARTFRDTNGRKFKFKVSGVKAGDEEFNQEFVEVIAKNIKSYMENEYSTYVEYDGEELMEQNNKQPKTADDFVKLRKDMFEMVGQAFKIPQALMTGNVTSLKDVCDVFLTFAVDPLADTITEVLNKRASPVEYLNGNYYETYTGKIKHRDLFDLATAADKLIAAAIMCPDEVREEMDLKPLETEWSREYHITKNYEKTEDSMKETEENRTEEHPQEEAEGGEENENEDS